MWNWLFCTDALPVRKHEHTRLSYPYTDTQNLCRYQQQEQHVEVHCETHVDSRRLETNGWIAACTFVTTIKSANNATKSANMIDNINGSRMLCHLFSSSTALRGNQRPTIETIMTNILIMWVNDYYIVYVMKSFSFMRWNTFQHVNISRVCFGGRNWIIDVESWR